MKARELCWFACGMTLGAAPLHFAAGRYEFGVANLVLSVLNAVVLMIPDRRSDGDGTP